MTAFTAGLTAKDIPITRARLVIQNLGPGVCYLETGANASVANGLQIPVGAIYELPAGVSGDKLSIVATASSTDVRILGV